MNNSSVFTFITISIIFGSCQSAIAFESKPKKPIESPILALPSLVEICQNEQPETHRVDRLEALAWLESQTSPLTLTIFSALWYGRNPDELEKTERPISAIEACLSYPNPLNFQLDTEFNTRLENRTQALEYWQSIIPEPTFIEFYQRWQTRSEE